MEVISNSEKLFFNTIKITTVDTLGQAGTGTGFLFQFTRNGGDLPLIVTNKHVIENTVSAQLTVHRGADGIAQLGQASTIEVPPNIWSKMWIGHPDPDVDIAVAAFGPIYNMLQENGLSPFVCMILEEELPTEEQLKELDALEEVVFVGYPNGVWDRVNALPVLRRGTTATPLQVDFENSPRFIIDASVFGGSSGSPVFISNSGGFATKDGGYAIGTRFYFIGVIAAVFYRTQLNEIVTRAIPTAVTPVAVQQEMIDLGIVFKARTVVETANHWLNYAVQIGIVPALPAGEEA
ncbi:trypsin-like serine peptidase [Pseudomonas putida]|nr:serine protease [Pseudomonas putida]ELS0924244.1 trypsin-like peptidase domain-containing protein [Pseudomonas putida]